jgi:hypothetical protein
MSRSTLAMYHCTPCDTSDTQWVREGDDPTSCPFCGGPVHRKGDEFRPTLEYYSDALGVAPNQIPEAKAKFPHHEFSPDGRLRVKSPQHRKKLLKELGFRDNG